MNASAERRLLVIDDMPAIHDDFRKILLPSSAADASLDEAEAFLFGAAAAAQTPAFTLDCASQGEEGARMAAAALAAGRPYALAFVDMRMPPGWDGVQTIEHLWQTDPALQVVICTAYSDHTWQEVLARLDARDRLLILRKPFDMIEVQQLANTLTEKWRLAQQAASRMESLESAVVSRTAELLEANRQLQQQFEQRKQLESRLVQSEKLASLGLLCSGVAHEINNPLGFLQSNFGVLEEYLENLFGLLDAYADNCNGGCEAPAGLAPRPLRDPGQLAFLREDIPVLMAQSKDGMGRVSKIVQSLKDFSRNGNCSSPWELADLHRGLDSTLNIMAGEIRKVADLHKEYGELPMVECLPSELNQVFMNLVINAAHAIGPARGQITIRTGCHGGEAWVEVTDNGCGIAPEVLPRIFDPFYTTKPLGQGTGLGLSLSYGIVRNHGGRIDVQSAPGRGTAFRILLPLRQKEAAPAQACPA
ncbi:ATP-binding protein [Massilia sp. YIM B04103]|uniref:ATP-binding protein n=1 Tax=Massilia sp. YIM B04103 TaxID=2963106 RepID=UPI00210B26F9|nr:ATP-binding protein [Massilia sp. YIM B04103]